MKQPQNGNHGACQLKRQIVEASSAPEKRVGGVMVLFLTRKRKSVAPYLVALRSRHQTRSCWAGWSCSPLRLIRGYKGEHRTIRKGWTWEQNKKLECYLWNLFLRLDVRKCRNGVISIIQLHSQSRVQQLNYITWEILFGLKYTYFLKVVVIVWRQN